MRKISFKLLTQNQLVSIDTNARTFGELKEAVSNSGLEGVVTFGDNQFLERVTKASFGQIDEALLPQGDCIFFVLPLKTKSGSDLDNMSYQELRSYGSFLNKTEDAGINLHGKREDVLEAVKAYEKAKAKVAKKIAKKAAKEAAKEEAPAENSNIAIIKECAAKILEAVAKLEEVAGEEYAYTLTLKELQAEAEELNNLLK